MLLHLIHDQQTCQIKNKFFLAADAQSMYLINRIPYLGKDELRLADESVSAHVIYSMFIDSYVNKGPNVTTENIFTSHELAEKLLVKSTSLVGTMNGKRKEVPTMSKICGSRL